MTDAYVDFNAGSNANSGADWANAKKTLSAGMLVAAVGGRCFVKTNAGGVKDTAAGPISLQAPANQDNPLRVYGCKSGTTATPPTASDLCVRGVDTLPILERTGSTGDIYFNNYVYTHGLRYQSSRWMFGRTGQCYFHQCELASTGSDTPAIALYGGDSFPDMATFEDCEVSFASTAGRIFAPYSAGPTTQGMMMQFIGGKIAGSVFPTNLVKAIASTMTGDIIFQGFDLSSMPSGRTRSSSSARVRS